MIIFCRYIAVDEILLPICTQLIRVNNVNIASMSCSVSNAHVTVHKTYASLQSSIGLNTTVLLLTVELTN